ncbi:MAG: phosphopentomutase [Tepidanaerobacteraceae bacterium]|nr:phosphopentomutase [Tepidanaerobacteraceae bacterium]
MIEKILLIVLDSVGIGELPDAHDFGDEGSNTLANTAKAVGGLKLPNLGKLGLGNIFPIEGVEPVKNPVGCFGKCAEISRGKDTTTGHWEMMGIISKNPFPTYPNGFPDEVIERFEKAIGKKVIGNVAASGTEIIKKLGMEHMKTGMPIVYTSADSVFQIAAHENIIPVEELYRICQTARNILTGRHAVGRVIARPFIGTSPENFSRTERRKDFSLPPPRDTVLDKAVEYGFKVIGVGKINDIFSGRGITDYIHTTRNDEGIKVIINYAKKSFKGILFANLGDFDTLYGHRNDVRGYKNALEFFDKNLLEILSNLNSRDLLIITADHGCDPTTKSTDHSREYTPLVVFSKNERFISGKNLGVRKTFADIGATISDIFNLGKLTFGQSFAGEIFMK